MPQPMQMPQANFSSLEEAWIDLSNYLDPQILELVGADMRMFFYSGAQAAFSLMLTGHLPDLKRDLDSHKQALMKEFGQ